MEGMYKIVKNILKYFDWSLFALYSYAIAVLPEDYQQDKFDYSKMYAELAAAGYKVKNTTVGDEGFKVEILNDK